MLEVDRVTVEFGGLIAVDELSFAAGAGEVCAIIGPNGAGKTTLFNAITGFVPLKSGAIRFDGASVGGLPPHKVAAHGVSRTFQHNGLIGDLTVLENVILGSELTIRTGVMGTVLGLPGALHAEREATARARGILAGMGLSELADSLAGELPFGQQRLVEICRALASGAKLLLLDEPAVGLFETDRRMLCAAISRLAADGVCVLLIEHVLDVVKAVADTVLVMNYGQLLAQCAPDALSSHQAVLDAYLGHG